RPHPLGPDQLPAPNMPPGQHHGWISRIQPDEVRANEVHAEVNSAGRQMLRHVEVATYPLHIGEPLGPQQLLGEIEGCLTRTGVLDQSDPCGLWRWPRGDRPGIPPQEPSRPCERHSLKESPPAERSRTTMHGASLVDAGQCNPRSATASNDPEWT